MAKTVEILLYDGVNELDFGAVYDVLTSVEVIMPGGRLPQRAFLVDTVADRIAPVESANGIKIFPQKGLSGTLGANILIIPGGIGARRPNQPPGVIQWLTRNMGSADVICSTGAGVYILGRAGLINNRRVTTQKHLAEDLHRLYPRADIVPDQRLAIDGKNMLTASGGSSAIDMALYLVQRFYGPQITAVAAARIDYPYRPPAPAVPKEVPITLDESERW